MSRWTHGEPIVCDDDGMLIRGHLSTAEAAEVVSRDDDAFEAVGDALQTWAHTGFYYDEDGGRHPGVHYGKRYKGTRGAFAVTQIDTRRVRGAR